MIIPVYIRVKVHMKMMREVLIVWEKNMSKDNKINILVWQVLVLNKAE